MRFVQISNLVNNKADMGLYSNLSSHHLNKIRLKRDIAGYLQQVEPILFKNGVGDGYFSLYYPDAEYVFAHGKGGCYRCFELNVPNSFFGESGFQL